MFDYTTRLNLPETKIDQRSKIFATVTISTLQPQRCAFWLWSHNYMVALRFSSI